MSVLQSLTAAVLALSIPGSYAYDNPNYLEDILALPKAPQGPAPITANVGPAYGPPATAPPPVFDSAFNDGHVRIGADPESRLWTINEKDATEFQDPVYGVREFDLPFLKIFNGQLSFYRHTNSPNYAGRNFESYGPAFDHANQTACGIPTNAYWGTHVAIHPYFLKYASLERMCMQDLCIGFWPANGGGPDMILKVADICSTDPSDPTYCPTPADIKVDRTKASSLFDLPSDPKGDVFPERVGWFFTKCWAESVVQPAYKGNWYAQPNFKSSADWSVTYSDAQAKANNVSYAARGFPAYQLGWLHNSVMQPFEDWKAGDPNPAWKPIGGGAQGDQI